MSAIEDIAAERQRQIEEEGWTEAHDDAHSSCQMAGAAACYALHGLPHWAAQQAIKTFWPWEQRWWKPTDRRSNLVKAGALIAAEIDRIDRDKKGAA